MSDRQFSSRLRDLRIFICGGKFFSIIGMTADVRTQSSGRRERDPIDESPINAMDGLFPELFCEESMTAIIFGDHKDATCVLVEAMNDTGPMPLKARGKNIGMMYKGINKRILLVAIARMDHEPCGLVDNNNVRIFMQYSQWKIKRFEFLGTNWLRNDYDNTISDFRNK